MKIILPTLCILLGYFNVAGIILSGLSNFLPNSYSQYSDSLAGNYSTAGGTMHYVLFIIFLGQFLIRRSSYTSEKGDYIYFLENHMLYKTTIYNIGDGVAVTERRG